ncbi:hypothetical protein DIPPA_24087 [Diplonema papillatum]|nr:hypothetical protein DIPPA_24087 [Diplonema papillatum]
MPVLANVRRGVLPGGRPAAQNAARAAAPRERTAARPEPAAAAAFELGKPAPVVAGGGVAHEGRPASLDAVLDSLLTRPQFLGGGGGGGDFFDDSPPATKRRGASPEGSSRRPVGQRESVPNHGSAAPTQHGWELGGPARTGRGDSTRLGSCRDRDRVCAEEGRLAGAAASHHDAPRTRGPGGSVEDSRPSSKRSQRPGDLAKEAQEGARTRTARDSIEDSRTSSKRSHRPGDLAKETQEGAHPRIARDSIEDGRISSKRLPGTGPLAKETQEGAHPRIARDSIEDGRISSKRLPGTGPLAKETQEGAHPRIARDSIEDGRISSKRLPGTGPLAKETQDAPRAREAVVDPIEDSRITSKRSHRPGCLAKGNSTEDARKPPKRGAGGLPDGARTAPRSEPPRSSVAGKRRPEGSARVCFFGEPPPSEGSPASAFSASPAGLAGLDAGKRGAGSFHGKGHVSPGCSGLSSPEAPAGRRAGGPRNAAVRGAPRGRKHACEEEEPASARAAVPPPGAGQRVGRRAGQQTRQQAAGDLAGREQTEREPGQQSRQQTAGLLAGWETEQETRQRSGQQTGRQPGQEAGQQCRQQTAAHRTEQGHRRSQLSPPPPAHGAARPTVAGNPALPVRTRGRPRSPESRGHGDCPRRCAPTPAGSAAPSCRHAEAHAGSDRSLTDDVQLSCGDRASKAEQCNMARACKPGDEAGVGYARSKQGLAAGGDRSLADDSQLSFGDRASKAEQRNIAGKPEEEAGVGYTNSKQGLTAGSDRSLTDSQLSCGYPASECSAEHNRSPTNAQHPTPQPSETGGQQVTWNRSVAPGSDPLEKCRLPADAGNSARTRVHTHAQGKPRPAARSERAAAAAHQRSQVDTRHPTPLPSFRFPRTLRGEAGRSPGASPSLASSRRLSGGESDFFAQAPRQKGGFQEDVTLLEDGGSLHRHPRLLPRDSPLSATPTPDTPPVRLLELYCGNRTSNPEQSNTASKPEGGEGGCGLLGNEPSAAAYGAPPPSPEGTPHRGGATSAAAPFRRRLQLAGIFPREQPPPPAAAAGGRPQTRSASLPGAGAPQGRTPSGCFLERAVFPPAACHRTRSAPGGARVPAPEAEFIGPARRRTKYLSVAFPGISFVVDDPPRAPLPPRCHCSAGLAPAPAAAAEFLQGAGGPPPGGCENAEFPPGPAGSWNGAQAPRSPAAAAPGKAGGLAQSEGDALRCGGHRVVPQPQLSAGGLSAGGGPARLVPPHAGNPAPDGDALRLGGCHRVVSQSQSAGSLSARDRLVLPHISSAPEGAGARREPENASAASAQGAFPVQQRAAATLQFHLATDYPVDPSYGLVNNKARRDAAPSQFPKLSERAVPAGGPPEQSLGGAVPTVALHSGSTAAAAGGGDCELTVIPLAGHHHHHPHHHRDPPAPAATSLACPDLAPPPAAFPSATSSVADSVPHGKPAAANPNRGFLQPPRVGGGGGPARDRGAPSASSSGANPGQTGGAASGSAKDGLKSSAAALPPECSEDDDQESWSDFVKVSDAAAAAKEVRPSSTTVRPPGPGRKESGRSARGLCLGGEVDGTAARRHERRTGEPATDSHHRRPSATKNPPAAHLSSKRGTPPPPGPAPTVPSIPIRLPAHRGTHRPPPLPGSRSPTAPPPQTGSPRTPVSVSSSALRLGCGPSPLRSAHPTPGGATPKKGNSTLLPGRPDSGRQSSGAKKRCRSTGSVLRVDVDAFPGLVSESDADDSGPSDAAPGTGPSAGFSARGDRRNREQPAASPAPAAPQERGGAPGTRFEQNRTHPAGGAGAASFFGREASFARSKEPEGSGAGAASFVSHEVSFARSMEPEGPVAGAASFFGHEASFARSKEPEGSDAGAVLFFGRAASFARSEEPEGRGDSVSFASLGGAIHDASPAGAADEISSLRKNRSPRRDGVLFSSFETGMLMREPQSRSEAIQGASSAGAADAIAIREISSLDRARSGVSFSSFETGMLIREPQSRSEAIHGALSAGAADAIAIREISSLERTRGGVSFASLGAGTPSEAIPDAPSAARGANAFGSPRRDGVSFSSFDTAMLIREPQSRSEAIHGASSAGAADAIAIREISCARSGVSFASLDTEMPIREPQSRSEAIHGASSAGAADAIAFGDRRSPEKRPRGGVSFAGVSGAGAPLEQDGRNGSVAAAAGAGAPPTGHDVVSFKRPPPQRLADPTAGMHGAAPTGAAWKAHTPTFSHRSGSLSASASSSEDGLRAAPGRWALDEDRRPASGEVSGPFPSSALCKLPVTHETPGTPASRRSSSLLECSNGRHPPAAGDVPTAAHSIPPQKPVPSSLLNASVRGCSNERDLPFDGTRAPRTPQKHAAARKTVASTWCRRAAPAADPGGAGVGRDVAAGSSSTLPDASASWRPRQQRRSGDSTAGFAHGSRPADAGDSGAGQGSSWGSPVSSDASTGDMRRPRRQQQRTVESVRPADTGDSDAGQGSSIGSPVSSDAAAKRQQQRQRQQHQQQQGEAAVADFRIGDGKRTVFSSPASSDAAAKRQQQRQQQGGAAVADFRIGDAKRTVFSSPASSDAGRVQPGPGRLRMRRESTESAKQNAAARIQDARRRTSTESPPSDDSLAACGPDEPVKAKARVRAKKRLGSVKTALSHALGHVVPRWARKDGAGRAAAEFCWAAPAPPPAAAGAAVEFSRNGGFGAGLREVAVEIKTDDSPPRARLPVGIRAKPRRRNFRRLNGKRAAARPPSGAAGVVEFSRDAVEIETPRAETSFGIRALSRHRLNGKPMGTARAVECPRDAGFGAGLREVAVEIETDGDAPRAETSFDIRAKSGHRLNGKPAGAAGAVECSRNAGFGAGLREVAVEIETDDDAHRAKPPVGIRGEPRHRNFRRSNGKRAATRRQPAGGAGGAVECSRDAGFGVGLRDVAVEIGAPGGGDDASGAEYTCVRSRLEAALRRREKGPAPLVPSQGTRATSIPGSATSARRDDDRPSTSTSSSSPTSSTTCTPSRHSTHQQHVNPLHFDSPDVLQMSRRHPTAAQRRLGGSSSGSGSDRMGINELNTFFAEPTLRPAARAGQPKEATPAQRAAESARPSRLDGGGFTSPLGMPGGAGGGSTLGAAAPGGRSTFGPSDQAEPKDSRNPWAAEPARPSRLDGHGFTSRLGKQSGSTARPLPAGGMSTFAAAAPGRQNIFAPSELQEAEPSRRAENRRTSRERDGSRSPSAAAAPEPMRGPQLNGYGFTSRFSKPQQLEQGVPGGVPACGRNIFVPSETQEAEPSHREVPAGTAENRQIFREGDDSQNLWAAAAPEPTRGLRLNGHGFTSRFSKPQLERGVPSGVPAFAAAAPGEQNIFVPSEPQEAEPSHQAETRRISREGDDDTRNPWADALSSDSSSVPRDRELSAAMSRPAQHSAQPAGCTDPTAPIWTAPADGPPGADAKPQSGRPLPGSAGPQRCPRDAPSTTSGGGSCVSGLGMHGTPAGTGSQSLSYEENGCLAQRSGNSWLGYAVVLPHCTPDASLTSNGVSCIPGLGMQHGYPAGMGSQSLWHEESHVAQRSGPAQLPHCTRELSNDGGSRNPGWGMRGVPSPGQGFLSGSDGETLKGKFAARRSSSSRRRDSVVVVVDDERAFSGQGFLSGNHGETPNGKFVVRRSSSSNRRDSEVVVVDDERALPGLRFLSGSNRELVKGTGASRRSNTSWSSTRRDPEAVVIVDEPAGPASPGQGFLSGSDGETLRGKFAARQSSSSTRREEAPVVDAERAFSGRGFLSGNHGETPNGKSVARRSSSSTRCDSEVVVVDDDERAFSGQGFLSGKHGETPNGKFVARRSSSSTRRDSDVVVVDDERAFSGQGFLSGNHGETPNGKFVARRSSSSTRRDSDVVVVDDDEAPKNIFIAGRQSHPPSGPPAAVASPASGVLSGSDGETLRRNFRAIDTAAGMRAPPPHQPAAQQRHPAWTRVPGVDPTEVPRGSRPDGSAPLVATVVGAAALADTASAGSRSASIDLGPWALPSLSAAAGRQPQRGGGAKNVRFASPVMAPGSHFQTDAAAGCWPRRYLTVSHVTPDNLVSFVQLKRASLTPREVADFAAAGKLVFLSVLSAEKLEHWRSSWWQYEEAGQEP